MSLYFFMFNAFLLFNVMTVIGWVLCYAHSPRPRCGVLCIFVLHPLWPVYQSSY